MLNRMRETIPSPNSPGEVRLSKVILVVKCSAASSLYICLDRALSKLRVCRGLLSPPLTHRVQEHGTVKPVYNGPVYIGHPVYYGHRTTSQNFQLPCIFCKGHPVYYGHRTTSQNFQLPCIFCKVDLYIAITLYITVTLPFPKCYREEEIFCPFQNIHPKGVHCLWWGVGAPMVRVTPCLKGKNYEQLFNRHLNIF